MLTDSRLMASAAWDAQSLNDLKTKAGRIRRLTCGLWRVR
jgi:Rod binding domain-containing protein